MRIPYVGATKHVDLATARTLGPRWVVQEKVDGQFARLYLDTQGRVARVFSRSGAEVSRELLGSLQGARIGRPHAELVGELEAHTEAGNAAAESRNGQRLVHLFDCLHDGTRSLARESYAARRDALWRMRVELEDAHPVRRRDDAGRFAALRGTQLAPILPQRPIGQVEQAWGEVVVEGEREGLVLVSLDARAGAPASKLKLKPYETLDAHVRSVSRTTVTCEWRGSLFNVGRGRHIVDPGEVVEVRHAGWYGNSIPRFPVLVRVRRDLH